MIKHRAIHSAFLWIVWMILASSCQKPATLEIPALTTAAIINVTPTALTSGGTITSDGGAEIKSRGVCWGTDINHPPTVAYKDSMTVNGSGSGVFISAVKGLKPATTYYIRAYATNEIGTGYGNVLSSMYAVVPILSTNVVTAINDTVVSGGGNIVNDGGFPVTARGVCWNTSKNPTVFNNMTKDSLGIGVFTSIISKLSPDSLYYIRAYATNKLGTGYGNERSFTIKKILVKDIDGNIYHYATIGSQVWLTENLKTTRLNDSTAIAWVPDNLTWISSKNVSPGYCWYKNEEEENKRTYGALYNWQAVSTGKLCPVGWHVPSDVEWTMLTEYLGGTALAGGKLKESSTEHWKNPNVNATNEYLFTALPGGWRTDAGVFDNILTYGYWWSSTSVNTTVSYYRYLYYGNGTATKSFVSQKYGLSVRCVKN